MKILSAVIQYRSHSSELSNHLYSARRDVKFYIFVSLPLEAKYWPTLCSVGFWHRDQHDRFSKMIILILFVVFDLLFGVSAQRAVVKAEKKTGKKLGKIKNLKDKNLLH